VKPFDRDPPQPGLRHVAQRCSRSSRLRLRADRDRVPRHRLDPSAVARLFAAAGLTPRHALRTTKSPARRPRAARPSVGDRGDPRGDGAAPGACQPAHRPARRRASAVPAESSRCSTCSSGSRRTVLQTRRLVDVAQDCIVVEERLPDPHGIGVRALIEAGRSSIACRTGSWARGPRGSVRPGGKAPRRREPGDHRGGGRQIEMSGLDEVKIRSALTCESKRGCAPSVTARDLARGKMVAIERRWGSSPRSPRGAGTQLTMRTFHIGGIATAGSIAQSSDTSPSRRDASSSRGRSRGEPRKAPGRDEPERLSGPARTRTTASGRSTRSVRRGPHGRGRREGGRTGPGSRMGTRTTSRSSPRSTERSSSGTSSRT